MVAATTPCTWQGFQTSPSLGLIEVYSHYRFTLFTGSTVFITEQQILQGKLRKTPEIWPTWHSCQKSKGCQVPVAPVLTRALIWNFFLRHLFNEIISRLWTYSQDPKASLQWICFQQCTLLKRVTKIQFLFSVFLGLIQTLEHKKRQGLCKKCFFLLKWYLWTVKGPLFMINHLKFYVFQY